MMRLVQSTFDPAELVGPEDKNLILDAVDDGIQLFSSWQADGPDKNVAAYKIALIDYDYKGENRFAVEQDLPKDTETVDTNDLVEAMLTYRDTVRSYLDLGWVFENDDHDKIVFYTAALDGTESARALVESMKNFDFPPSAYGANLVMAEQALSQMMELPKYTLGHFDAKWGVFDGSAYQPTTPMRQPRDLAVEFSAKMNLDLGYMRRIIGEHLAVQNSGDPLTTDATWMGPVSSFTAGGYVKARVWLNECFDDGVFPSANADMLAELGTLPEKISQLTRERDELIRSLMMRKVDRSLIARVSGVGESRLYQIVHAGR
jgi:hypothetical protein